MAEETPQWVYRAILFSVAVLFLMPVLWNMFITPTEEEEMSDERLGDLLQGYNSFTGSSANLTQEQPWALSGIYTPYLGASEYNYTPDQWLYGSQIGVSDPYLPSQYEDTVMNNTGVLYDASRGAYYYVSNSFDGHKAGDLYTAVTMDVTQKSDIFFTPGGKQENSAGYFWYSYSGYRFAFSPVSNYTMSDQNGGSIPVEKSKNSLSLIWYDYYGQDGLSGQLMLGYDRGVAYLTSTDIIRQYNEVNSTAKFELVFSGGVPINLYIRINPYYLTSGMSIEECWNYGYWEIMVSTNSTNISTYTGADYSFNIYNIWDTFVDLFTFNTSDYNISGPMGTVCSLLLTVTLYALLLSIALINQRLLIFAGLMAAIQLVSTAIANWDLASIFDGLMNSIQMVQMFGGGLR